MVIGLSERIFCSISQKTAPLCLPVSSSLGYLLGGAAGGVLAGRIFERLHTLWLRRAFAVLILYGGIRAVLLL